MARLTEWLRHRQDLLAIGSQENLAESADVGVDVIATIHQTGSLRRAGRSARCRLARALKVTVRDLESLASGRIDWIDDSRIVDFDRLMPAPLRIAPRDPPDHLHRMECPPEAGIPIVGRILSGGVAEFYGDPAALELDRLPLRLAARPDAFALHALERSEPFAPRGAVIFDGLAPGRLCLGQTALITRDDLDQSIMATVSANSGDLLGLVTSDGRELMVPMEAIVRAAAMIGSEPF